MTVLAHWQHKALQSEHHVVLPDGCEDLICSVDATGKPTWFISDLASQAYGVDMQVGDITQGLRFQAGARINKAALLASIHDDMDMDDVRKNIGEFVVVNANVDDALTVLRIEKNVTKAARVLGVSSRSLQRLLVKHTHKPPSFWLRLGRVRACAQQIVSSTECQSAVALSNIAYDMGYADQAHMAHEFKHWLGVTPRQFRQRHDLIETISASGYGTG